MKHIFQLLIVFFVVCFLSCKKTDNDNNLVECNLISGEIFSAALNNSSWNGCKYKATYFYKDKQLCIASIDEQSKNEFRFYIQVDSVNPLKTYFFGRHSIHGLEMVANVNTVNLAESGKSFCDLPKPNVGGEIKITQLDTITKKLSATFSAIGYNPTANKFNTITNGIITNIKLDTSSYMFGYYPVDKSFVSATINNDVWRGSGFFIKSITTGGSIQGLEIKATGYTNKYHQILDYYGRAPIEERFLSIYIPTNFPLGTYTLYPERAPYFYAPVSSYILFSYSEREYFNRFQPTSGFITITNIDRVNRNLDATFSAQTKDSLGNSLNFTNGKVHIVNWIPF